MYIPVFLSLEGRRILFIGGGQVALQKIKALEPMNLEIHLIGQEVLPEIKALTGIRWQERAFFQEDLQAGDLVYACTNDKALNRRIGLWAKERNLLVNVASEKEESTFISPAVLVREGFTVAVSSGGKNIKGSVRLRNEIQKNVPWKIVQEAT